MERFLERFHKAFVQRCLDLFPNITGDVQAQSDIGIPNTKSYATGAFVAGDSRPNKLHTIAGYESYVLDLDASQANSLYSGSTFQNSALQALVCIKV